MNLHNIEITNLVVKILFKLDTALCDAIGPRTGQRVHHLRNSNSAIDSNASVHQLAHAFKTHYTCLYDHYASVLGNMTVTDLFLFLLVIHKNGRSLPVGCPEVLSTFHISFMYFCIICRTTKFGIMTPSGKGTIFRSPYYSSTHQLTTRDHIGDVCMPLALVPAAECRLIASIHYAGLSTMKTQHITCKSLTRLCNSTTVKLYTICTSLT